MSKSATIKSLTGALLAIGTMNIPMDIPAANPVEECSKELLISYFPEDFVKEALKKHNVPQDKWGSIVNELNEKNKEVIKIVEQKASKLDPNPLKDPQQRQAAVKIFRETLKDIFSGVLKKNGITDENQIQQMLDEVQQQKAKRFAQCMEQQRPQSAQPVTPTKGPQAAIQNQKPATQPNTVSPNPAKSNANDDSDDDDSDDDDSDDDDDYDDDDSDEDVDNSKSAK